MIDEYTLRARVAPVLIVLAPPATFLTAGILDIRIAVITGAFALAALILVSQLGRDAGKRIERDLWDSWGGAPTAQRLRYPDGDPAQVQALHERLERFSGERLPSRDDEANDPAQAYETYERVVAQLRERTRSKDRFPLVFNENADYGFRRNLLGLRRWGIAAAILTLGATAAVAFAADGSLGARVGAVALPLITSLLCLCLFVRVVTPSWVRAAADRYAERLFGALAELGA